MNSKEIPLATIAILFSEIKETSAIDEQSRASSRSTSINAALNILNKGRPSEANKNDRASRHSGSRPTSLKKGTILDGVYLSSEMDMQSNEAIPGRNNSVVEI